MKRTLEIGALCEPISKQLAGMLLNEDADQLDRDNDAITRCNLMGYMPVHFVVKCESMMSAHILAATLGSEFTIITEQKTPLELECVGRRVSRTP